VTLKTLAKAVLPERAVASLRRVKWERERRRVAALKPLNKDDVRAILADQLGLGQGDLVYVLGDVGRGAKARSVSLLAGRKRLIAGNGDDVAGIAALGVFESISVAKSLTHILLTHIPVHPSQLRRGMINIHGHLHARTLSDPRYICVSLEQTDFRPVLLDELVALSPPPCRTATGR